MPQIFNYKKIKKSYKPPENPLITRKNHKKTKTHVFFECVGFLPNLSAVFGELDKNNPRSELGARL